MVYVCMCIYVCILFVANLEMRSYKEHIVLR